MNTPFFRKTFFTTLTLVVFVSVSLSAPQSAHAVDTGAGFDVEASLSGMNPLEDIAGIALTCAAGPAIAETVVPAVSAATGAIATFFWGAEKTTGATNVAATAEVVAGVAAEAAIATAAVASGAEGLGTVVEEVLSVPTSNLVLQTTEIISLALQATQAQLQVASAMAKTPKEQQSKMTNGIIDCIAFNAGQKMLEQLTNNTVQWIQGGFHGSPSFSVNTHEIFLDLADMVAGDLARDLRGLATCDFRVNYKNDLANQVELSAKREYKFNSSVECPFPETFDLNSSDFYNGINKWSWEGIEYALQENGNPFGVALLTGNELALRSAEKEEVRKQELSWSSGFTNIVDAENCNYKSTTLGRYDLNEDGNITKDEWDQLVAEGMITNAEAREQRKLYCKTTTPGKLLGDKLSESTGVDMQRLGLVDSINKIIGAVISQVTKQASIGIFNVLSEEDAVLRTEYVTTSSKTAETIAMENTSIRPYYNAWQAEIQKKEDAEKELTKVWDDLNLWNSGNSTITDPESLNKRRTELEAIIALAPERIATAKAAYDQVSSTEMAILRQQELVAAQEEVDYAKEGVRDAEYDYTVAQADYYKALATEMDVVLIRDLKQVMLEQEAILVSEKKKLQDANKRLYDAKNPPYSTSPSAPVYQI